MANVETGLPTQYAGLLRRAGKTVAHLDTHRSDEHPAIPDNAISLSDILHSPEFFAGLLSHAATERQTTQRVLASVIHQNLALDIIGPLTLKLFLDGETYLPTPDTIWFDPRHESGRWVHQPNGITVQMPEYVQRVTVLVNDWYPVFRKALGVSAGAYWSSTGLGLCAPYSALYDSAPPNDLCQHASNWLARFHCDANRFIDWIPFRFGATDCAIPQRRGCCQKYRLPGGGYCGTCGIYRKQRIADSAPPTDTKMQH